jgi:hypothetical protein
MSNRTVEGTLKYCDYLVDKGYASSAQIDPWRTAVRKVFETVEGADYGALDWTQLDLDEYLARFQTLAGAQYKSESITAYGRRLKHALGAHEHYLTTGKAPSFRKGTPRLKAVEPEAATRHEAGTKRLPVSSGVRAMQPDVYSFDYPLSRGMAQVSVPLPLTRSDIERLSKVLATLEQAPQIPERTGDSGEELAA